MTETDQGRADLILALAQLDVAATQRYGKRWDTFALQVLSPGLRALEGTGPPLVGASCPVCGRGFRTPQGRGGHLAHSCEPAHVAYAAQAGYGRRFA